MKRGVPPTDRNARTGEFTPPGISFFANANSLPEVVVFSLAKGRSLLPRNLVTGEKKETIPPRGGTVKTTHGIFMCFSEDQNVII
jgi:hypothetical protein